MRKNKLEKLLSNPTVIVVLVPAIATMMSYMFKIGYCSYFEIPFSLVSVSAKDISVMAVVLMAFVFVVSSIDFVFTAIILDPVFKKYEEGSDFWNSQYDLYSSFVAFFLIAVFLFLLGAHWVFIILVSIPLIIIPIQFVVRHIKNSLNIETPNEKKKETHFSCPSIFERVLGFNSIVYISLTFFIAIITLFFGMRMASLRTTFYKIDNRDDIVGIEIAGDCLIAKSSTEDSLTNNIIINLSEISSIEKDNYDDFQLYVRSYNIEKLGLSDLHD